MTKKNQTPSEKVDEMLASLPPMRSRHRITQMPELVEAIKHFLELKRNRDPRANVSFAWFYRNKLREAFDGPGIDSARKFCTEILKVDYQTGEPFDEESR